MSRDVDVVVVSYNSAQSLRGAVEPLVNEAEINVFVVDNASNDNSLSAVRDLPLTRIALNSNRGFAHGCNTGWRAGSAPLVLFLNPDARIDGLGIQRLAEVVEDNPRVGIAGPRIANEDGSLDYSIRRFPRIRSAYAEAFFLQRLFPRVRWIDEVVRDASVYQRPAAVEWLSGACLLVKRDVLEELDGWDEGFFLYCEDIDLCKRAQEASFEVRYEPSAVATHVGGGSGSRAALLPVLAASRVRYAQKHEPPGRRAAERFGFALGALTHAVLSRGGLERRAGHARSFRVFAFGRRATAG
jgi:GT2 family glycosyltransferase